MAAGLPLLLLPLLLVLFPLPGLFVAQVRQGVIIVIIVGIVSNKSKRVGD